LAAFADDDEDLFTGTTPAKIPLDVQRFTVAVKRALESGEIKNLFGLADRDGMTGTAWVIFRAQLPELAPDQPLKVKRIELVAGVGDDAAEFKSGTVLCKRAAPATHLVSFTVETAAGELRQYELPAGKVADPINNNVETWRLLPGIPQLPVDSTLRLEEARTQASARPTLYTLGELAYLQAALGHRAEAEKTTAELEEMNKKRPTSYSETQLGWIFFNLGDLPKSLAHFKDASDLAVGEGGRNYFAEYGYAVALYLHGDTGDAVKHFDHAAGLGYILADRTSLEEYLKNSAPREREAGLALQQLWLRTSVPPNLK
jgi:tetratricopeptide (TPR) repeat protein